MEMEEKNISADDLAAVAQEEESFSQGSGCPKMPRDAVDAAERENEDDIALALRNLEIAQQRDIHQWRSIYLARSYYLVGFVLYVAFMFLLFSAVGFFKLSDSVLIALLTTTLVHVIGILLVAFKWLYKPVA